MENKLYVISPIDGIGVTKGKPYEVVYIIDNDLSYVCIENDDYIDISIFTEKSIFNCACLNDEAKWKFCDEYGKLLNK